MFQNQSFHQLDIGCNRFGENVPQEVKNVAVARGIVNVALEHFFPILALLVDILAYTITNNKVFFLTECENCFKFIFDFK